MKKFLALVLSLVMAMSLITVAWGEAKTVTTFDALKDAVAAGGDIKLGVDIGVSGDLDSTQTIRVSNEVNLDLNGYTLYGPHIKDSQDYYAFIVETGGTLTLTDTSAAQTGEIKCHYSGIETKGGTFIMDGGKVTADDALYAVAIVNYGGSVIINDGEINAYDTAVTTSAYFTTTATTKVNGGEINLLSSSINAAVFETGGDYNTGSASVEITGGEVNSNSGDFAIYDTTSGTAAMVITGGTFDDADAEDYLAAGYVLENGVVKAETPVIPANAVTAKSYKMTSNGALMVGDVYAIFSPAVAATLNDDGKQTNTADIGHYTFEGLNCVVAASLADADVVLYSDAAGKNVMMYLKVAVTSYDGTGTVYANFGKACGQVTYTTEAGKTYYTTNALNDTGIYVADAKEGTKALAVGGALVSVNATPVAYTTAAVQHAAIPAVKDGKVTGYTCATCKIVAVEAPNYMSIPKGALTDGLVGNWYWPVASSGTTTSPTVQSAETFDAGIAMYVGMSVMAAAGSAVVIGKKKD